jgi:hypothetical protein
VGTLIGACTSGSEPATPQPTGSTTASDARVTSSAASTSTSTSTAALPLDRYLQTPAIVSRAAVALVRACMKEHGFSYRAPQVAPTASEQAAVPFGELRYGLVDITRASRYAYSNPPERPGPKQRMIRPGGPDRYDVALDGSSGTGGGCQGEADQRLALHLSEADSGLPGQLDQASYERAARSAAVARASTAWSRCMAEAGRLFDTPFDAASAAWPEHPDGAEIATALVDVRCKQQVDWLGAWRGAQASAERSAVAQHGTAFARIDSARRRQVATATAILRGQG